MNKKSKLIIFISVFAIILTASIIAFADQENNFEIEHEHDYSITAFKDGVVTFTCEECGDEFTEIFEEHLNEKNYELLDMNNDGIVNGKDYGYLLQNFGEKD